MNVTLAVANEALKPKETENEDQIEEVEDRELSLP